MAKNTLLLGRISLIHVLGAIIPFTLGRISLIHVLGAMLSITLGRISLIHVLEAIIPFTLGRISLKFYPERRPIASSCSLAMGRLFPLKRFACKGLPIDQLIC